VLDAGATVALATNCNPGSSYTTSMSFCIALAVRDLRMTIEEALWSATAGGAAALRRSDIGRLAPGARADLVVLDAPSYTHLVYRPGVPLVASTIVGGVERPSGMFVGAVGTDAGGADEPADGVAALGSEKHLEL
jgi:imidazolonepropionase